MKNTGKIILYGFLIWLSVFAGAMLIFKLHENDRIFFETLICVICTSVIVLYSVHYFKKVQADFINEGIRTGMIWLLINLAIDIPMFSFGPMAKPLWDYFKDIGFMYVMIPVITISIGNLLNKKLNT